MRADLNITFRAKGLRDELRRRRPGLRCLFMSGYTADVIAETGVLQPDVHFLQKPFNRDELGRKVQAALAVTGD